MDILAVKFWDRFFGVLTLVRVIRKIVEDALDEMIRAVKHKTGQIIVAEVVNNQVSSKVDAPGIGESTLLLQMSAEVAERLGPVLYVSGEDSAEQIKLRADRLDLASDRLLVLAETSVDEILLQVEAAAPRLIVIDSIQTM